MLEGDDVAPNGVGPNGAGPSASPMSCANWRKRSFMRSDACLIGGDLAAAGGLVAGHPRVKLLLPKSKNILFMSY